MAYEEASLVFSILGFLAGIIAIIITWLIYGKVQKIKTKQEENAEAPYATNTIKNMNEIHDHFRDVVRLVKKVDGGDQTETHSLITENLNSYYSENLEKMKLLLEKSERDLLMWINLDKKLRIKHQKIIESFRWLIQDFFKHEIDEEVQTRMWRENYEELLNKKYEIEKYLNNKNETLAEV